jgi:hypothetical protein
MLSIPNRVGSSLSCNKTPWRMTMIQSGNLEQRCKLVYTVADTFVSSLDNVRKGVQGACMSGMCRIHLSIDK